jgi:hypothetical protein
MEQQSYFDGGNQPDSREYRFVALACVSGTPRQWKRFDVEWMEMLKRHRVDFLHTTDAYTLNGIYSREKGWDEDKRDAFLNDCVTVASHHAAQPDPFRPGLYSFTAILNLYSFKRARKVSKNTPASVIEILTPSVVNQAFIWGEQKLHADGYHFFWDQNEPYRGHVETRIRNPRYVRDHPIMEKIITNSPVNMRRVPALQLADLFAWCYCHARLEGFIRTEWQSRLFNEITSHFVWFNYDELRRPIGDFGELNKRWKLPIRGETP